MEYDIEIDLLGNKCYFKKGTKILHREDGPAIEYSSGSKSWYIDGYPHREDGPAVEIIDEHNEWWVNGKLHRIDGPAIEYFDEDYPNYWWINGQWLPLEKERILNKWWNNKNGK